MTTKPTAMKLNENLSRRQLMQLELLIASVVPAAAILVVGVAGTAINFNPFFLILDVLTCAVAVFFGERSVILKMQHIMDEQLSDLITRCREFIGGNRQVRVSMPGDDQLAQLASTLNSLFDHVQITSDPIKGPASADDRKARQSNTTNEDLDLINQQLNQLVEDISPALKGDLRVKASIDENTPDDVAMVADLCDALVEKLVQFARWTLYASSKIIRRSRHVLDRSIELAKTTEIQVNALGTVIAAIEEQLVAFIQRIGSDLQLNVDIAQEIYAYLQESKDVVNSGESYQILEQLTTHLERHLQLLEGILESTHDTTGIADSALGDLYAVAQQFHQTNTNFIKAAEQINSIVTIAEDWFTEAEQLSLPPEEE
jgi:methyl-accepting chemotaxis protein